jgi:hypothetical protein
MARSSRANYVGVNRAPAQATSCFGRPQIMATILLKFSQAKAKSGKISKISDGAAL